MINLNSKLTLTYPLKDWVPSFNFENKSSPIIEVKQLIEDGFEEKEVFNVLNRMLKIGIIKVV